MSRENVTRGLSEVASQLADLKSLERKANFAALRASGESASLPGEDWTYVDPIEPMFADHARYVA